MNQSLLFIIFFAYTFALGLLLHFYLLKRSNTYKIKKANTSAVRWSSQSKPILGGITFYVLFLFSIINYALFFNYENLISGPVFGAIIVLNISFLMGLADDMLNTPPGFKFIVQIFGAIILIVFDLHINIFETDFYNYVLTIFWFVGVMNSINMLDNMDSITTSIGITILIGALVVLSVLNMNNGPIFMVCIAALAGLLSFLFVNWHPAKMYMGDNGSQFLGALIAIIGIIVFWNGSTIGTDHPKTFPFLIAFIAFIIPITDTTTVTINRLMRKQSPFIGGRDHTTHHLSYLGLSDRKIAILLLSLNGLGVFTAVFLLLYPDKVVFPLWLIGLIAIFIFGMLYANTKLTKPKA